MGFNSRTAVALDFNSSPLLPQADTSQAHDIPTGVSPTTSKLQDWIAWLRNRVSTYQSSDSGAGTIYSWSAPANTGVFMYISSTDAVLDVSGCVAGDVLDLTFCSNAQLVGNESNVRELRMVAVEDYGGAGTVRTFDGTVGMVGNDGDRFGGIALMARHTIVTAGPARIVVQAGIYDTTGQGMRLTQSWTLHAVRYRS